MVSDSLVEAYILRAGPGSVLYRRYPGVLHEIRH